MNVVLFKSSVEDSDKPDKFHSTLTAEGYSAHVIPVITFAFCNLPLLEESLKNPTNYSGIIFTSQRCIQAMQTCVHQESCKSPWNSCFRDAWSKKRIFCVGPATADKALELLSPSDDMQCKVEIGTEATAESLAHKIIQELEDSERSLPLLYPCGNLKRDTLQNILRVGGVETHSIVAYETLENPKLKEILESKVKDISVTCPFVFFSPSGIHSALVHWKSQITNGRRVLVALGPTTKEALLQIPEVEESNVRQCESPTPQALVKILKDLAP